MGRTGASPGALASVCSLALETPSPCSCDYISLVTEDVVME